MLNPRTAKHTFMFIALAFIIAALSLLSLSVGGVSVPLKEVLASLAGRNAEASDLIIMQFRLPRITAAILIGAALAVAGALLQGVIRNPLASPDLLGVTGGASVAVVAFMTFVLRLQHPLDTVHCHRWRVDCGYHQLCICLEKRGVTIPAGTDRHWHFYRNGGAHHIPAY